MGIKIAIAGNPNCGKTTLFNLLTGSNQFVGNWPGVTVEKKEGALRGHDDVTIVDLPGIYSLSPYTLEEVVARKYLVDERPDAILNIVDGTNLERNLYLTTQLIELGIPVVIAINMMDVVRKVGDVIDINGLSRELGCKIVEISALKSTGIDGAVEVAVAAAREGKPADPGHNFIGSVEHAIAHIEEAAVHDMPEEVQRWYAIKIFERDSEVLERLSLAPEKLSHIEKDIKRVEEQYDDDAEGVITNERYNYVERVIARWYKRKEAKRLSVSHKIDRVVTNRYAALPIFALIMFLVYFISVSTVGTWATDFMNEGVFGEGWYFFGNFVPGVGVLIDTALDGHVWPWLQSLIVDGIVGGVGAVLGFVPQMLVLFLLLAFLEACGYMSRVAFVMDRIFRKFGLSGKSFIPMLIGTGCGVPGIMASRTIENESDRRMTVMTTTFVPCGAKLPVIALIASAFFDGSWWVAPVAYFIGIFAVVISGIMLKKTKLFGGEASPFVMELPAYHMPTFVNLMRSTWDRGWSFIKKAGTVILLSSIIIWALASLGFVDGAFTFDADMDIENSLLGYFGGAFSWLFAPLGFGTIEATVATFMGLLAKEEIVGVFGVIGNAGLSGALAGFSFLVFNLLCAPCFAAMGAIRREMNSARWTAFAIGYQCVFAYLASFCIYNIGTLFMGEFFWWEAVLSALALVIIGGVVYMMARKNKNLVK